MTTRNPTPLLWRLWLSRFFKAFASGFTSVLNFGFSFYLGEYVLFLRQHDHFSAPQIGIGLAMGTLGVIGALVAGPHVIRRHPAWVPVAGPSFVGGDGIR